MNAIDPAATGRYLTITSAHHRLNDIASAAGYVNHYANELAVLDDDDGAGEMPLRDALVTFRNAAGEAATGRSGPLEPDEWTRAYADAMRTQLGHLADEADTVADGARAVIAELDEGMLTGPRTWQADEISGGAMRAYLERCYTEGGDASHLLGCVYGLLEYRPGPDRGDITEAVYDHHMRFIDELWCAADAGVCPIATGPAGDADRLQASLDAWRPGYDEANEALAKPLPYMHAAGIIERADTFNRLNHYATSLTSPEWQEHATDDADRLMIRLVRHVNTKMGIDAAGVDRTEATVLTDIIARWRLDLVDDAANLPNTIELDGHDEHGREAIMEDAYKRLCRAAEAAVNTGELLELWRAADVLDDDQADRLRVAIAIRFDDDQAGIGGAYYINDPMDLGELRRLVDAHEMPVNAREAMTYRIHAAALAEIDMHNPDAPTASVALARVWEEIASDADSVRITRRQLAALRNLANVKIADYCDGDKYRAESIAARLPEWDRIGEDLAA